MKYSIGIDIGGTNTVVGLTTEEGKVVAIENLEQRIMLFWKII